MGLFQNKKTSNKQSPVEGASDGALHFFDDYYREELRKSGREYFEKVINANGELFKKDLDATVAGLNKGLKDHIATEVDATLSHVKAEIAEQLDGQFVRYRNVMKDAQDAALKSLDVSAQNVLEQHKKLSSTLENNVARHETTLTAVLEQSQAAIAATQAAQAAAIESLNQTAAAIQQQHELLAKTLESNVKHQENVLVDGFEQNMAQIIEHYLLGALGDQYDMKAQLPSIIKQMEANKQAIVEDMKL